MGEAIKEGVTGILQRQQAAQNALTQPLTPEEIWRQAVQSRRGFESSPSGANDRLRGQPATISPSARAGDKGITIGKGYETFSGVQVLDKGGRRVGFGADHFSGGGLDDHAEARVVRGLEKNGPASVPDGRLVVVVEQDCCSSCERRLIDYARKIGATEIEVHVPQRESLVKPGVSTSPKTAATSSLKNLAKPTHIQRLRSISVPRLPVKSLPMPGPASHARTAVIGTIASLGAGLALGILQKKMKEKMLDDLAKLPKPRIDQRGAAEYFHDPVAAKGMRTIDLMAKQLVPFGEQLQEHHVKLLALANLEVAAIAISTMSNSERLEFLSGLQAQHTVYGNELLTVRENLEAAQALGPKALDAARGAEQLAKMMDNALVADWLFKQGFSVEELADIYGNLNSFASRVKRLFDDVDRLHALVEHLIGQQTEQASQINKIYWSISLAGISEALKKADMK